MGKDQEWVQAVKTQDVQAINRILSRCKTNKSKLLGSNKKMVVNIQDDEGSSALHQAVTANNVSTVKLLLDNGAQIDLKDNKGKRALHCAAQLGNSDCVRILLEHDSSVNDPSDNGDIPLHLACRQGFSDVSEMLMSSGACYDVPNREQKTPIDLACEFGRYGVVESFLRRHLSEKTYTNDEWRKWLQLAAANGHMDVARLLTACCSEDTVEEVWADDKHGSMKLITKDLQQNPRAIAVADYDNPTDMDCLLLKQGDLVTVLEQNMDGRWKGSVVSSDGRDCRTGYFPHQVVQMQERPVGGNQRTGTIRTATIKKVPPPTVPGTTNRCSYTPSGYGSPTAGDVDYGGIHLEKIVGDSQASTVHFDASNTAGMTPSAESQVLEDQGIEVEVSPGRESPGGSSVGCLSRHSTASVDSGRSSIPSTDSKVPVQRTPAQVYESFQISNYYGSDDCVNVAEMIIHNVPDAEILKSWLMGVHFEEYTQLFLQAGYDMPTVSRMTPEDLTAVGITKPAHRRKLKAEIAKLNISDGIPDYKPDSLLEWLQLLRLEEYHETLCQQGFNTVDKVADLAWEDLEEIGIQKLGHQKKIMLAIKRVRDINSGIRRPSVIPPSQQTGRGVLSRPQTLGPVLPISSYQYHCQEVAITTVKVKTSPSNEICNAPELKTFQQSPTRNEAFKWPPSGEALSPSHQFDPHMVGTQMQSPNRGHSLENLEPNDSVSITVPHHSYLNSTDTWYDTVSAWRQHGYDTDSELSIRGDHGCAYEADGTATLHRPKGLVKPRPIAKIVAKSRHSNQISDTDSAKGQLKSVDHKNELPATQGSNQSGAQPTNTSSIYGTLKYKRTPPPPPKRSNSIKSDPSVERSIEAMKDEAFATCVKGLASHFNISTKNSDLQPDHNQERTSVPEEFPPPPSPLPSATAELNVKQSSNVPQSVRNDSEQNKVPELFSNAMFQQRRKHSVDSSTPVTNTESNTMPFANENVSTIKQKVVKPQANLQESKSQSSSPSILRKTNLILPGNKPLSAKRRNSAGGDRSEDTGFTRKVAGATEDVIDDIEHMLTSLSNQLDAMLEDEQLMKEA